MLGDPESGRRHAEKGLKIHRDTGVVIFLSLAHFHLGWIYLELGNLENARSLAEEALRLSQKNNEKFVEGLSWLLIGTILGKTDPRKIEKIEKAEGCLLKGIEIFKELRLKPYYALGHLYLGQLYLNAGEKEKAIETLKKAEGMFQKMEMNYWLTLTRKALA